jgi:hypothetical protein
MNRTRPGLISLNPEGTLRKSEPAESVLIEAIMTAASALSERLGLGPSLDFEHRFEQGGLLIHTPDPSRSLILCHTREATVPLLRMSLREAARTLPPQDPVSTPVSFDAAAFPDPGPLDGMTDFGNPFAPQAPTHSLVYNPFTSA